MLDATAPKVPAIVQPARKENRGADATRPPDDVLEFKVNAGDGRTSRFGIYTPGLATATSSPAFVQRNMERECARQDLVPRYDEIVAERNHLVAVQFSSQMTKAQENRLAYLRWQLDRAEDAMNGEHLDKLAEHAAKRADLAATVSRLVTQLNLQPSVRDSTRRKKR